MAQAKGATQGDVVMAESDSFFVTVRLGEIEKISQAGEKRLGLRLFFGSSSASASTSDISKKSIERLVEDTAQMARATAQDPYSGLPAADGLALTLHVDGAAGGDWTLAGETGRWILHAGEPAVASTRVRMTDDVAWRLLFNALPERDARSAVAVEGRVNLAEPLLNARSIVI